MRHFTTYFILCALAFILRGNAQKIEVSLSSSYLLPSERAILEYIFTEGSPPDQLPLQPVPGITIQKSGFGGPNRILLPSRKIGYSYQYIVSSTGKGKRTIPSISLRYPNKEIITPAIDFEVIDPIELTTQEVTMGNRALRYAAFFRAAKTTPYEGEIVPVELKIYFPSDIDIVEWGIPDFERNGITAWRFEPRPQTGGALLLGQECQVATYPSNFSAIKAGLASIGPAKIRLIVGMLNFGPFGSQQDLVPLNITASPLEINALPLPPNAPDSFTNAVGDFTMNVNVAEKELREGDPVNVEIEISGSGNLDSLAPPKLSLPEGWKLYDATRSQLGQERRYHRGSVNFTQFMRPTESQGVIPPFHFSFFDPVKAAYVTLRSSPIPLTLLPATTGAAFLSQAPPPALDMPVERMTDILGIISNAQLIRSSTVAISPHLWHLLPALVVISLLVTLFRRHFQQRKISQPHHAEQRRDWKDLAATNNDNFLRSAARFIERWHPNSNDPELTAILKERDMNCYLPSQASPTTPAARKKAVISQLRKLLSLLIVTASCLLLSPVSSAAEAAPTAPANPTELYEKGQYKQAVDAWFAAGSYETLTPQTLFNIGNACYRIGSAGHAALYYRRALLLDPTLAEARQNLRFIERKFGMVTIQRPDYQHTLTKIPLAWIQNTTWATAWLTLIAILIIFTTSRGHKLRIYSLVLLLFIPFILTASIVAWSYYPDDAAFAPYREQAIVTSSKAALRTDASRTSAEVMDPQPPPGSLCRILRHTGKWCYVSFATQTRGWLEASQLEPLIPTSPPKAPVLKASEKADEVPST